MGKIGDIFVKLGLKKDEFDKGLNNAGTSLKGFAAKFGLIAGVAQGVAKAVMDNAVKMAQSFISHSQKIGDAWDQTMSRAKAAWGQFLTALTSWDWDGFGDKMRRSMDAAAASTAAHDAEFEVQNSIQLRKSRMQEELAILQIEMRNEKNSYEKRAEYARQYLEKVRPLYQDEENLRKKVMDSDIHEYLAKMSIADTDRNRAQLQKFLEDVAPNPAAVKALAKQGSGKYATEGSMADFARGYQELGNKDAEKVVKAISEWYASKAGFDEETRRIQQIMNSNEAKIDTSAINTQADIEKERAEKILKRAQDSAKSEVQLLTEKYDTEKELLKQFGMETQALTDEYYKNIFKSLNEDLDDEVQKALEIEPVELELFEIDMSEVDKVFQDLENAVKKAEEIGEAFRDAVIDGFSAGCQELTDQLMGVKEINAGAVFQAILTPLADMAMKTGEVIMAQGVAVEAAKLSLTTLGGAGAIAAGAALVAAGAALKSGLSRIAQGGGAGTSVSSVNDGSSGIGAGGYRDSAEITVHVEGMVKGGDIVLAGSKTQNNWRR